MGRDWSFYIPKRRNDCFGWFSRSGYQPLVAAGGTATVSATGTITSVSIGNSGSGYRSGIQTNVSVGVQLPDIAGATVIPIGVASVSDGHVTSVAITTDRVFYAQEIYQMLDIHTQRE